MPPTEPSSAEVEPVTGPARVVPALLDGGHLLQMRSLVQSRARVFLQVQTVLLLVAFSLTVLARASGVLQASAAPPVFVAISAIALVTALGWTLLRTRLPPRALVLSVLLVDAVAGYPIVFLVGGAAYPMTSVMLLCLVQVPIFAGRRFALPMAFVHWVLFTSLLVLHGTGILEGHLPEHLLAAESSLGAMVEGWLAFSIACISIPVLVGQAPIDLLKSQAQLADQVQRNTSALERASRRLVTANGDLTELNQELAETIAQLGVVNDQLGRSNADLARANADLGQANADLEVANVALQRSNERLDQFNTAVSHDLRAPLQAITARAELAALAAHNDPGRVSRMADQICDSAERMARQLDELHKLSRVEDRLDAVDEVHLGALLGEIAHDLDPRIRERRVHLEVVHPLPKVMGSRALLAELFQNLLDNAVKYGGKGGPRVRVAAAEAPDGWVAASVEDDGPGIPDDQRARVFQLFRRLPRDQGEEGLGAGLAIVRRIAHVHGGSVSVEQGRHLPGARFVVRLPGTQQPGQADVAAPYSGAVPSVSLVSPVPEA